MKRVASFKYLGFMMQSSGDLDKEITHRIQSGRNTWRKITGVVCDRRVPIKLKYKIHNAVVRPALMYGSKTAPFKKRGKNAGRSRDEDSEMDDRCHKTG